MDLLSIVMLQYYSQHIKQRPYRASCYIPRLGVGSRVTKETEDANPALKEILQIGKQAKASLGADLVNVLVALYYRSVSGFINSIT